MHNIYYYTIRPCFDVSTVTIQYKYFLYTYCNTNRHSEFPSFTPHHDFNIKLLFSPVPVCENTITISTKIPVLLDKKKKKNL